MVDTVWAVNAVAGAPSFSGKQARQTASAAFAGATSARPLGSQTGVRPGTPSNTVTATSTTWTVLPFAGVADVESSAIAGPYQFAFDANATGSVTAANATNPRVDIIYVQIDDPAETDGSSVPAATRKYLAGTAAPSPVAPALPVTRAFVIANINVPVSGGGSPTVTWVAPYAVAAGGIQPVPSSTGYPASPSVGQYVDDAALGGPVRYNGSAWWPAAAPVPACRVTVTTAGLTTGLSTVFSAVPFNVETYDTNSMHDNVTNPSRITVPVAGYYRVKGKLRYSTNASNGIQLAKNGTALAETQTYVAFPTTAFSDPSVDTTILLAAGDYVECWMGSVSAGAVITQAACYFEVVFVRGA